MKFHPHFGKRKLKRPNEKKKKEIEIQFAKVGTVRHIELRIKRLKSSRTRVRLEWSSKSRWCSCNRADASSLWNKKYVNMHVPYMYR